MKQVAILLTLALPLCARDKAQLKHDLDQIAKTKTLMRLAQLVNYPVDVNLWMPIDGAPDRIHIVIRNRYEMSQFWKWGDLTQPMPPLMRSVLENGKRNTVDQKPQYISVLAPVRNSLNDIVGLVEVVSEIS